MFVLSQCLLGGKKEQVWRLVNRDLLRADLWTRRPPVYQRFWVTDLGSDLLLLCISTLMNCVYVLTHTNFGNILREVDASVSQFYLVIIRSMSAVFHKSSIRFFIGLFGWSPDIIQLDILENCLDNVEFSHKTE